MKGKTRKMGIALAAVLFMAQILNGVSLPDGQKKQAQAAALPQPVYSCNFNQSVGTAQPVMRENDTLEGSNPGTLPAVFDKTDFSYAEGIAGKGIVLDGSFGLKLYPEITGEDYSVSFWVKPDGETLYSPLFCAGEGFLTEEETSLEITGDDTARPLVLSTSPEGGYFAGNGQNLKAGEWNHVCMAVGGSSVQIYVNGKNTSNGMVLEHMLTENTEYYLGIDCCNRLYEGIFDNLECYNACLSAEQVQELYQKEKNGAANAGTTGVSLNKKELVLSGYGTQAPLYASVEPPDAGNQKLRWASSNEKTATVQNGVVTAWSNGTAVVTAETEEGSFQAQCRVTVTDISELKELVLNRNTLVLEGDGSSSILTASASPQGAHLPELIWKTSDQNVAATDQAGNVTAVANGTAVITAESEDGKFSASCQVTVQGVSKEVAVEHIELSEKSISLSSQKKTYRLTTKITPVNAANQQCTYYSGNEEVAVVDKDGRVTAVGNGTTEISVLSSDGRYTDSCKVKVTGFAETKIKSIRLDYDSLKIAQGEIGYLYAETFPVTATETLQWSSSNTGVADVVPDEFGTSAEIIVYADAVMGSTAMITAYTENGVSAECFIEVAEYGVKSLSVEKSSICLRPGESFDVDMEIKPEAAKSTELVWKTSNPKAVTVNAMGLVRVKKTASAGDRAKITSATLSGTKKTSFLVQVKEKKTPVKKLTAKKTKFTLQPGGKAKFAVSYSPKNATGHTITYQSQNPGIVKIDSKGNLSVPAGYSGSASVKITAKTKNGKKVTGTVLVKQKEIKIKNLNMSRSSLDLYSGNNTTLYVDYKPGNATKADVTWTSSNEDVVKVVGSGKKASVQVRRVAAKGSAVITAKDANGAMASCQVSVRSREEAVKTPEKETTENTKKALKSISFGTQSYLAVKRGKTVDLKKHLSITPVDAEYRLSWANKNRYISVNSSGIASVSAKAPKKLEDTILVTSNNGKKASIYLIVQ